MKTFRRIILSVMTLTLLMNSVSFAGTKTVTLEEYDPRTMTVEERSEWVDANVEPMFYSVGESVNLFAVDPSWRYTTVESSYVGPSQYTVGQLETCVRYKVDTDLYSVENWDTFIFEASVLASSAMLTETVVDSFWIDEPGNYRIVYEAWFADPSGGQFIEHWYNLYGDGKYSVRVVNGIGET